MVLRVLIGHGCRYAAISQIGAILIEIPIFTKRNTGYWKIFVNVNKLSLLKSSVFCIICPQISGVSNFHVRYQNLRNIAIIAHVDHGKPHLSINYFSNLVLSVNEQARLSVSWTQMRLKVNVVLPFLQRTLLLLG